MVRRPPRSTRTDTLFPYTTLFRSPELMIARRQAASLNQHLDLGLVGADGERTLVPPRHTEKVDIFRSEEPTSELQSLMRISYAFFCLHKQNIRLQQQHLD